MPVCISKIKETTISSSFHDHTSVFKRLSRIELQEHKKINTETSYELVISQKKVLNMGLFSQDVQLGEILEQERLLDFKVVKRKKLRSQKSKNNR